MNTLLLITALISSCAIFSYINVRVFKLPMVIGVMIISLFCSILIIIIGKTNSSFYAEAENIIRKLDFSRSLLNVMLGFLLFSGSLHVNTKQLFDQRTAIISFSTVSIIVSTFLFGTIMYFIFIMFNTGVEYIYCLLFGALVSPTDPIAVLGILKKSNLPAEIETTINAESLFNDGIAVVLFITIGEIISDGIESLSIPDVLLLFSREVFGGLLFGLLMGYGVFYMIRNIDHYQTEIFISLALVMICGTIAPLLHVSGPLAVIVAGIIVGNKVRRTAMSEKTKDYYEKFWELIDDFFNTILFVLIGLQIILLSFSLSFFSIALLSIVILLLCRYISLLIPILFLRNKILYNNRTAMLMTWGGLRGGLSLALTLSLPENQYKDQFVLIVYMIVLFSIIFQGLTTKRFVAALFKQRS